jgi:F-type H+-transporting ATPase subunit delta
MRLLTHPAVPAPAKREAIGRFASEAGAAPATRKLLMLMADRDRLGLLSELNQAYQARLTAHLGIVQAHVTTAVPLSADRVAALTRSLEQKTGQRVQLTTEVDPAILGGAITRLGSKVFDGSVVRQLERLRERLVSEQV